MWISHPRALDRVHNSIVFLMYLVLAMWTTGTGRTTRFYCSAIPLIDTTMGNRKFDWNKLWLLERYNLFVSLRTTSSDLFDVQCANVDSSRLRSFHRRAVPSACPDYTVSSSFRHHLHMDNFDHHFHSSRRVQATQRNSGVLTSRLLYFNDNNQLALWFALFIVNYCWFSIILTLDLTVEGYGGY